MTTPDEVKRLASLVLELSEAVDNAAADIGGSRPQLDILREAVEAATVVNALSAQAAPAAQPVAWREHVEQRLLTWRQRFVNRSGDQLALDDFMDKESLDDLIDFVCDEYAGPAASPQAAEQHTKSQLKRIAAQKGEKPLRAASPQADTQPEEKPE